MNKAKCFPFLQIDICKKIDISLHRFLATQTRGFTFPVSHPQSVKQAC